MIARLDPIGYFVGALCFAYIHESKNYIYTVLMAFLFPLVPLGVFSLLLTLFGLVFDDNGLYSAVPSIFICVVLFRFLNRKLREKHHTRGSLEKNQEEE